MHDCSLNMLSSACDEVMQKVMQRMRDDFNSWKGPALAAAGQAHIQKLQEQLAKDKNYVEYKKQVYAAGIEAMGKRSFESLIKDAAMVTAKQYIMKHTEKIQAAAIAKFRKSVQYQTELQQAKLQQKAKDKEQERQRRLGKVINKMKKELKGMKGEEQSKAIEQYGLQKIKDDSDALALPELRPKWVELKPK